MKLRPSVRYAAAVIWAALVLIALSGCGRDTGGLPPAPPNTDPIVFDDNFGSYATYQAFLGSKLDAVTIDTEDKHLGTSSLKVVVPGPGDASGTFAGGAFTTTLARQLSGYDALTFWAKASKAATLNVAGLGNDNTGTSLYEASWKNIALTESWTKYVIPIPLPARLVAEQGLFFFAEGHENDQGYTLRFDEVRFEKLGTISNPRPSMFTRTVQTFVGATVKVEGTQTLFDVGGTEQRIEHMPGYFTFASSADSVAAITSGGIQIVGPGSATITAKLDSADATGAVTVIASAPPATAAPAPTVPAANVISLFSNSYANAPVDTWSATWDDADVADARIAGNDVKVYTSLSFAGIEFTSHTIDASAMTHLHLDVWAPQGILFKVKLVDFGANGVYDGGGDDREHELSFTPSSVPPFTSGNWAGLEIPLANFTNLTTRAHLAQLILSGDTSTVYIDNVYLHK